MNRILSTLFGAVLAGCSTTAPVPDGLARLMTEAPEDTPARLLLTGNSLTGAAVASGPGSLPRAVRTAIDAVAPHGETTFQGREWGSRGEGFRIEKRYRQGAEERLASALIADDGRVLERAHSVPLGEVPQPILGAALGVGPEIERAMIVSGPEREEYWQCTVGDRIGRTFVARITLDGVLLQVRRRVTARIDV
ncbi:MAG: hypothetical protein KDC98_09175 [Planctomycetes bacterium]|nr:hypothetical protein [Planctomycetota bacterium]